MKKPPNPQRGTKIKIMIRNYFKIQMYVLLSLIGLNVMAQHNKLEPFDEVIISPHIEVKLIKGTQKNVNIDEISVDESKINIEIKGNTLRIYLEDAKEITKTKTVYQNGRKMNKPIYVGTQAKISITYDQLKALSVRGEERVVIEKGLKTDKFRLKLYGEPLVIFDELHLDHLNVSIYGEGVLKLNSGSIKNQKFTVYGEAHVNTLKIVNDTTKITSYGEAEFQINASEEIKVTAFGESVINYTGHPNIKKGITLGDLKIKKIKNESSVSIPPENSSHNPNKS